MPLGSPHQQLIGPALTQSGLFDLNARAAGSTCHGGEIQYARIERKLCQARWNDRNGAFRLMPRSHHRSQCHSDWAKSSTQRSNESGQDVPRACTRCDSLLSVRQSALGTRWSSAYRASLRGTPDTAPANRLRCRDADCFDDRRLAAQARQVEEGLLPLRMLPTTRWASPGRLATFGERAHMPPVQVRRPAANRCAAPCPGPRPR